ncbi:MAG: putative hydro-lyase [Burkholderiaceae bacterium]|jgi:uncharacterized protein YcsI (UPF0317 family)
MQIDAHSPHFLTPAQLRALCRSGEWQAPTAGVAAGFVQANLVILPREFAFDFLLFCQRNPKPCPLIEVLEPGVVLPPSSPGADIRFDLPAYRVYQDGELVAEPTAIDDLWRDDLVSFLIGCSFSFEAALMAEGLRLRHVEEGLNVAMYRTNRPCAAAGRLFGNLVVSMRPLASADVTRAVEISARFPKVHGAPVHIGHPEALGIFDLAHPDYGDPVAILPGELPVFWACGVTPQAVIQASRLPFCITHAPGKMFVTDLRNEALKSA